MEIYFGDGIKCGITGVWLINANVRVHLHESALTHPADQMASSMVSKRWPIIKLSPEKTSLHSFKLGGMDHSSILIHSTPGLTKL